MTTSASAAASLHGLETTQIFDQLGDCVLVMDRSGDIIYVNAAFELLTGYSRDEAIGRKASMLNSGHHPPEVFQEMWASLHAGRTFRFILTNMKKNGELYHQGTLISPVRGIDGEISHFVAIGRNVVESRQTYDSFTLLANVSPSGVSILQDGKFFFINEPLSRCTGYGADELIGLDSDCLVLDEDKAFFHQQAQAMLLDDSLAPFEYRIRARDGSIRWLMETLKPATFFGLRAVSGAFVIAHVVDITDRKRTEDDLKQALSLSESTIESTTDGMLVTKLDSTVVSYNRRFLEMWAMEPMAVGMNSFQQFEYMLTLIRDPEAYRATATKIVKEPMSQATITIELHDERVIEIYTKPQLTDGEPVGRVWSCRDVTERKQFESQLVHLASKDGLTGLLNRRRLQEEMEAGVAKVIADGGRCSLLLLDIDRFKEINDALGHHAGDDLLVRLAEVMAKTMGDHVVARFGGDEFAVFMQETDREAAEAAAALLTTELRSQSSWDAGARLPLTVSIGVAVYPDHASDVDELCSHADIAMYNAKTAGRNRVSVYSPRLQQRVLRFPRDWRERITSALDEERLTLYEQPIVDSRDGTVSGHELLVRLLNTDGTVIPARHFIPFAEQSGLIQGIDQWVTRAAINLAKQLQATGSREYLAFNLSRWAFVDPEMLDLVRRELEQASVDPSLIVVEMTETSALSDITSAERFMHGLRGLDCRFALDDFGVGYSSFHHLKRLPVDFLKIDGSFVRDISHSGADHEIVAAMVKIARGLGLQTIAEAVHSQRVFEIAREIGVDTCQGYWVARPAPAVNLLRGLHNHDVQCSDSAPKAKGTRKPRAA